MLYELPSGERVIAIDAYQDRMLVRFITEAGVHPVPVIVKREAFFALDPQEVVK